MIIISVRWLGKRTIATTIWPFIFVHKGMQITDVDINHEKIHLKQQVELLVIPFYILYFSEYLIRLLICGNGYKAYKEISFEREAYENQGNLNYIAKRNFWNWINYF